MLILELSQKGYNIAIAFLCAVVLIEMNYMFFSSYSFSAIFLESNEDGRSLDRKVEDIWSYILNLTEYSITTVFVITEFHCILIKLLKVPYILAFKSRNFVRFQPNFYSIRLIRRSPILFIEITFYKFYDVYWLCNLF